MASINLLPWREERRQQRKQQFIIALAVAAMLAVVLAFLAWAAVQNAIESQQQRNAYLESEIAALDEKIREIKDLEKTRDRLLARMEVITQLQASRAQTVHFFDEIASRLPDGTHLNRVEQKGQQTIMEGLAESNARVSDFMRELDASEWFGEPRLVVIETEQQESLRVSRFTLSVRNVVPKAERESGMDDGERQ